MPPLSTFIWTLKPIKSQRVARAEQAQLVTGFSFSAIF